ncbi:unnamed protein product [Symbiodinium natans]|uniref:Uncharacterized protein n=1 Tax=Symbiodinium natans TaxID=878477 RepID=A0A812RND1_9DINO|nr:unnamed protein product [Symbiodinium natans]
MASPCRAGATGAWIHESPLTGYGGGFEPTALRIARINEDLAELQMLMESTVFKLDDQQACTALMLQRLRSRLLDSLCPQKLRKTERLKKLAKRLAALEHDVGREQAECVKAMEAVLATVEKNGQVAEAVCRHLGSRKHAVLPQDMTAACPGAPFASSPSLVGQLGRILGTARVHDEEGHHHGLPNGAASASAALEAVPAQVDIAPVSVPVARQHEADLLEEAAGLLRNEMAEPDQATVSSLGDNSAEGGLDAQLMLYMSRFRSVWDAPEEHRELSQAPWQATLPGPAAPSRLEAASLSLPADVSARPVPEPVERPTLSVEPGSGDRVSEEAKPSSPNAMECQPESKTASHNDALAEEMRPSASAPSSVSQPCLGHAQETLPAQSSRGDLQTESEDRQTKLRREEGDEGQAEAETGPDALEPAPPGPMVRRITSSAEGSSSVSSVSSDDSLAKAKAVPRRESSEDSSSTSSSENIERA